jgi:branched-chain amino acid transport system substrate-binding protein
VTLGTTGASASVGISYKNAFQLMPKTIGGLPARFIIYEDNADPKIAANNARKLIA